MGITHVIRGEDHLPNTPKQIQIYQALGLPMPEFAHIPMILGPDRTKLSKRHGATAASQYEDEGFLPEAMMNYLALLGWSYNGTDQIFSQEELIKYFTLDKCSKNPAIFDVKKLSWMNGVYIRELSPDDLYERMLPYLQKDGLLPSEPGEELKEYTKKVLQSLQTRAKTMVEMASSAEYFFRDEVSFDPETLSFLEPNYVPQLLSTLSERLAKLEPFTAAAAEELFNALREELGLSAGEIIHPVRVALTGKKVSPGIYEVIEILGRARVSQRLREGALKAREMQK
jgi:glutamyl-tRNA synthetase